MDIDQLLEQLAARSITLNLTGDSLQFHAPREAMTAEIVAELRLHKQALIDRLSRQVVVAVRAIPRRAAGARIPLSFAQQRLWFLDRLGAAGDAYQFCDAVRLRGLLDRAALKSSLNRIVARHDSLRTRFVERDGEPEQLIEPRDVGFVLCESDLASLPAPEKDRELRRITGEEASRPFELDRAPLIRGHLVRLDEQQNVLLLSQHHINTDGWSSRIFLRELSALYGAFAQGQPDPLPELPLQYADYASWQRQWLQGERLRDQLAFWKRQLEGAPALLQLPTDRPRPAIQRYLGGSVVWQVPAPLTAALRAMSRRHGSTLFMTLLAAWSALLSRLSGQDEVVIGTPVANRQHAELEPLIGLFVNTLALRVQLQDRPTVAALMHQVKALTLQAFAHQDLPFEQVVEAVQPPRSMGHNPVFQSVLTLNNSPNRVELQLPGLALEPVVVQETASHFDLSLSLTDHGDELTGEFSYASDLFEATTIRRWGSHLLVLLQGMTADDQRPINSLPLLDATQYRYMLQDLNPPSVDRAPAGLVHELFERQAALRPQAVALEHEGEHLSYGELNAQANRLAHHLLALGVGPDERVAVCAERGLLTVVGLLAVLKANGAYVPLDPGYPLHRLMFMLQDSQPKVLLADASAPQSLVEAMQSVVRLDALRGAMDHEPSVNPLPRGLMPSHLAYIIYTSGSTGQPKGVMVEHAQVTGFLRQHIDRCSLGPTDRALQFASFAFDASVEELWGGLGAGATVCLRPTSMQGAGAQFVEFLRSQRITVADLPTAVWHQWCTDNSAGDVSTLPELRLVVLGGEQLAQHSVDPDRTACAALRWLNTYGPTETTVYVTSLAAEEWAPGDNCVPIGRPTPNARLYVLDADGQPVPIGVVGELVIGGPGVARGYLNRPELTAERFVHDPFSTLPGARMYRSGDLGRWLPGGRIEYVGRNDAQIKLRGFRIELGEVEAALRVCTGVREAAVLVRGEGDSRRLLAYLVADVPVLPGELRNALTQLLPDYMIPSAFIQVPQLPLTANGKLDHRALPVPGIEALATHAYEPPRGPTEETIARIWQELLQATRIGRQDHFFDLGGHSLLAVQLVSRLRQELQVELPLHELFAHPTLTSFSDVVVRLQLEGFSSEARQSLELELANLSEDDLRALLSQ